MFTVAFIMLHATIQLRIRIGLLGAPPCHRSDCCAFVAACFSIHDGIDIMAYVRKVRIQFISHLEVVHWPTLLSKTIVRVCAVAPTVDMMMLMQQLRHRATACARGHRHLECRCLCLYVCCNFTIVLACHSLQFKVNDERSTFVFSSSA